MDSCFAPVSLPRTPQAGGKPAKPAIVACNTQPGRPTVQEALERTVRQSAWFRAHNRSEDVENLFMVGAGTHPGAGIPGVLMSAKTLEQVTPDVAAFA